MVPAVSKRGVHPEDESSAAEAILMIVVGVRLSLRGLVDRATKHSARFLAEKVYDPFEQATDVICRNAYLPVSYSMSRVDPAQRSFCSQNNKHDATASIPRFHHFSSVYGEECTDRALA